MMPTLDGGEREVVSAESELPTGRDLDRSCRLEAMGCERSTKTRDGRSEY